MNFNMTGWLTYWLGSCQCDGCMIVLMDITEIWDLSAVNLLRLKSLCLVNVDGIVWKWRVVRTELNVPIWHLLDYSQFSHKINGPCLPKNTISCVKSFHIQQLICFVLANFLYSQEEEHKTEKKIYCCLYQATPQT